MTKRWSGRVIKHLDGSELQNHFGKAENKSLRDQYYEPLTVVATEADAGKTIREVLEQAFGMSSKLLAQARATEYGLTINEERVYISAPVEPGEVIRLRMEIEHSEDIMPQPMSLSILYEDNYLLIVNKPAGMVVHPTHGHYTNTLANGVMAHWLQRGERFRFRPIHRLDEETSGVVAIAKNAYIHQQLSEQMQQGKVDKRYVALVYGKPDPAHTIIDLPIDRDKLKPHLRTITSDGYPSQTIYWVENSYSYSAQTVISIVSLKLLTGRTHQIRVHMSSIGHPLIGDKLYGIDTIRNEQLEKILPRHALHAQQLSFTHPMSKEHVTFEAELPNDLRQFIVQQSERGN